MTNRKNRGILSAWSGKSFNAAPDQSILTNEKLEKQPGKANSRKEKTFLFNEAKPENRLRMNKGFPP